MPRNQESSQEKIRRMEMDAFAAKKGEIQNKDLPFEHEEPGSAEDAAKLERLIEKKNLLADKEEYQPLVKDVDNLMDQIKKHDKESMELSQHDMSAAHPMAEAVSEMLDLVDKNIEEVNKDQEATDAPNRLRTLNRLRHRLAEKYDRFEANKKFAKEFMTEQHQVKTDGRQAAYRKEISQPSVIVRPERPAAKMEMPEPAEDDREPPIYKVVDGKYVNINDLDKQKPSGLMSRFKKYLGLK